ncbi:hypothetical protein KC360_g28 [Hortaea werneckii]|nr:hypothetical protein KC360_g28 [Hortaea werneckii]
MERAVDSAGHTGYECAGLQAYAIEDVVGTGVISCHRLCDQGNVPDMSARGCRHGVHVVHCEKVSPCISGWRHRQQVFLVVLLIFVDVDIFVVVETFVELLIFVELNVSDPLKHQRRTATGQSEVS